MGVKEVAAGAEWLDNNFPGWEREIDLGTLSLDNCQECICGQSLRKVAFGAGAMDGYHYATYFSGRSKDWAIAHGFYVNGTDENWRMVEGIWVELIKERFNTGNLSDNVE